MDNTIEALYLSIQHDRLGVILRLGVLFDGTIAPVPGDRFDQGNPAQPFLRRVSQAQGRGLSRFS